MAKCIAYDQMDGKSNKKRLYSPVSSFHGVLKLVTSSQAETTVLMTELMVLMKKGAISKVLAGEENTLYFPMIKTKLKKQVE